MLIETVEVEQTAVEQFTIRAGGRYRYVRGYPKECIGAEYRVHRFVLDVPSYQQKVLVEALTGHDAGLWFVVSPANFASRYEPMEDA